MNLTQLRETAAECRLNPDYRLRNATDEEFNHLAHQSYNRLPEDQQAKVLNSWEAFVLVSGERPNAGNVDQYITEMVKLRFLAQTNLFFLCKLLVMYSQVSLAAHEYICNNFFVQKDPTCVTFRAFADNYVDLKNRLLLVPRGGFKSSIDIADCVQWIICFPEVTIAVMTGVYKLAGDFITEIRSHFELEKKGEETNEKTGKPVYKPRDLLDRVNGDREPSLFQVLFPEHCTPPGEGLQTEFQTPAIGGIREPSVRAASIEQALSGSHYCVMKLDDVVTNENSLTRDRLDKVNKQIGINKALLHPYGFLDVIGTWYDENDYYGKIISKEIELAEKRGLQGSIHGSIDSGRFDSNILAKVHLRAALWLTEEAKRLGKVEEETTERDWVLWFPELLSYQVLMDLKEQDPDVFPIKYLNDPRQIRKIKFPRELLMRRTVPHTVLPSQGIIVTTIDTAYSTKSWADYTVIITALIYGGRFYIINMVRGRYNEYDLPSVIAGVGYKWKPKRICIENSVGVKWLSPELRREMQRLQISIPVEYASLGLGSKAKSKQLKAKPVLRLLGDERLYFSKACEGLEEIYNELEQFTGTSDDTHDDIVSALSLLVEQFGSYAEMGSRLETVNVDYAAHRKEAELSDLVYCTGKYANLHAPMKNMPQDDNPRTAFQAEQQPGYFTNESVGVDPFSELMG